MGNTATKFRKALVNGDEPLAWQLYEGNPQFREGLDPNASYGEPYQHNTPLHYACRHGMARLLRSFLFSKEGNPNKRNLHNETCLHVLCQGPQILLLPEGALSPRLARPQRDEQRRADSLQMILSWTGARLDRGQYERANVNATDNHHSTCLHYAAAAGLKSCVELLVQSEADLFVEDEDKLTPCDHAERQQHRDLALSLESQMVFSQHTLSPDTHSQSNTLHRKEPYEGLKLQDLRRLKDMLIVETADMLQAPLFTAEALLRAHDWDREKLLEAWMGDAEGCCQRSGVAMPTPPPSGYNAWDTLPSPRTPRSPLTLTLTSPTDSCLSPGEEGLALCGICLCSISVFEDPVDVSCGHEFCRACWEGFLNVKIQEGEAHNIFCPAYACYQLVPVQVIESVVSREMDKRYLQFDIKAFVENNPAIRWCPAVRCERAVRLTRPGPGDSDQHTFPLLPSPAVDCGKGHLFCWECLGEAHEPCDCQTWRLWLRKVAEMKPEELAGVGEAYEDAANCLWLLTNSKPCANCKSPIQKNEGCNHMQCAKCKYDFCWICLEEWKKHSSSTGGYYRCTRYEVIQQLEEQSKDMTVEAEKKHQSFQELDRFMHYYSRYKNHEHSYKLEQKLLKTAKEKMEQLSRAFIGREGSPPDTRFIEDGVCELLKTRRVLKCSYPYGFFLQPRSTQKEIFELMQTDLEMVVEDLAQKVNRPYLRTPCHRIVSAACLVQQKRGEFLASVARGVAPNDSPEAPRRNFPGGSWDWEYLGFASPEMLRSHSSVLGGEQRESYHSTAGQAQEYADFQYRRRHRPRRRGDMLSVHSLRSNSSTPEPSQSNENTEGQERGEGRRRALGSLDEDDPNILLAIQLSLQESRMEGRTEGRMEGGVERVMEGGMERETERGTGQESGLDERLERGMERGVEPRVGVAGVSETGDPLNMHIFLGASGSSLPSLLEPSSTTRTESNPSPTPPPQAHRPPLPPPYPHPHPQAHPPPQPSLTAELLQLGDSLMRLGHITTPYDPGHGYGEDRDQATAAAHTRDITYQDRLTAPYTRDRDHATGVPSAPKHSYDHSEDDRSSTTTTTTTTTTSYTTVCGYDHNQDQDHCHSDLYTPDPDHSTPYTPHPPVRDPNAPYTPHPPVRDPKTPYTPHPPVRDPNAPYTPHPPVRDPNAPYTPQPPVRDPNTPHPPVRDSNSPYTPHPHVRDPNSPYTPHPPVRDPNAPYTPHPPVRDPNTPHPPVRDHSSNYPPHPEPYAGVPLSCTPNPGPNPSRTPDHPPDHAPTLPYTPDPGPIASCPPERTHPNPDHPHHARDPDPPAPAPYLAVPAGGPRHHAQLCLSSPELPLSPVVPPGGAFTPSDPDCLEPLDPTASAALLDNIMAWFHHVNPQSSPQNLALIPSASTDSPPTTETETDSPPAADSPPQDLPSDPPQPDSGCTAREGTPAPLWQPREGGGGAGRGRAGPPCTVECLEVASVRPSTLQLERGGGEQQECVDTGCVSDLSLDAADAHATHSHVTYCGHAEPPPAQKDSGPAPPPEEDQSPEEWEEQVHLV